MWTQISTDDMAALQNFVAIMLQMDPRYAGLQVDDILLALRERQGEAWHFQGNGFEIVMLFQYSAQRIQWQLTYLGFVGAVQSSDALSHAIDRANAFQQAHSTPFFYAFRPSTVEYPPLAQLYALALVSPLLQITVVQQADQGEVWQIEYIGPPTGDMASAGKWLHVTSDDPALVRRYLKVMNQMGDLYRRETVNIFNNWVGHKMEGLGGAYYYWLPDSEVVVRLGYLPRRKQFEIMSVGVVGEIAPSAALDLVVEKIVEFLRSHNAHSAVARRPKQMKAAKIMQLHDLVPSHGRMHVTVERDAPNAVRWSIAFPDLVLP